MVMLCIIIGVWVTQVHGFVETHQLTPLLDAAKAVLRGKCIAANTYIKKEERSQISNLTLHLKGQEKGRTN